MMYTCKDEFNKKGGWESKAAEAQHLYTPQKKKKSKFLVITIDYLLNSQAQPFIRTNKVQKLNLKSKESK